MTLLVSKFERLRLVKESQQNMYDISVTLLVLKFETLSVVKMVQPQNMYDIFVTLLVLKFPKFIEFRAVNSLNK